jgi:hypothetical protein
MSRLPFFFFFDEMKWELVDQGHASHVIPYDLRVGRDMYGFLPCFAVVLVVCKYVVLLEVDDDPKKGGFFAIEDFQVKDGEHGRALNLSPSGICFDKTKEWITFCDSHHQKLCKKHASVNGLTVIDCMKRRTATLEPIEPYLTLSYVWGHTSVIWDKTYVHLPPQLSLQSRTQ